MSKFIGKNIFKLRSSMGFSQEKLSEVAGVSYQTVFRAESKGVVPRGGNLGKIARALGVTESDLYNDPDKPEKIETTADKSQLITTLITILPTLNENELGAILKLATTFSSSGSAKKDEVG